MSDNGCDKYIWNRDGFLRPCQNNRVQVRLLQNFVVCEACVTITGIHECISLVAILHISDNTVCLLTSSGRCCIFKYSAILYDCFYSTIRRTDSIWWECQLTVIGSYLKLLANKTKIMELQSIPAIICGILSSNYGCSILQVCPFIKSFHLLFGKGIKTNYAQIFI